MSHGTHTHWRMTINNPDETDYALVQQGYPDHIRQLVYTKEVGEEGTPHIQAFIKMKRDCRLSHMKKLFPRGNFGFLDGSEYRLNSQRYAQKLDGTAVSPAVISNFDPLHTIEGLVRQVVEHMIDHYADEVDLTTARRWSEGDMVREDYTKAKTFVSSTYKTMWRDFGNDMYECLYRKRQERVAEEQNSSHTHTHTHTDEKLSHEGGITNEDAASSGSCSDAEADESDEDDSSSETEGCDTSGCSVDCSSDDCSGE